MRRFITVIALLAFVSMLTVQALQAQEHPGEHPGKTPTKQTKPVVDQVKDAVAQYIKTKSDKGGNFLFADPKSKQSWELKLAKLHPVRKIDDDHYFLCSDFSVTRAPSGEKAKMLDLDFFLVQESGKWKVTDNWLHKRDGKPVSKSWVCPMHKDVGTDFSVKCPVCGMDMKKVK